MLKKSKNINLESKFGKYSKKHEEKPDLKAIVPCILVTEYSACPKELSIYKSSFKSYELNVLSKLADDFHEWKLESFLNRENSDIGHIRFNHADKYLKNMTTMTDLTYRIEPERCRQQQRQQQQQQQHQQHQQQQQRQEQDFKSKMKCPVERDPTVPLGNLTTTGLLKSKEINKEKISPVFSSIYQTTYVPKFARPDHELISTDITIVNLLREFKENLKTRPYPPSLILGFIQEEENDAELGKLVGKC